MPRRSKSAPPKRKQASRTISGRGDYATVAAVSGLAKKLDNVLKKAPKGSFANKGSSIGASIGRAFGSGLSAITGYGDYTVRGNSLGTVSTSTDMVPEFVARREGDHSTRIRHREFLFDLKVPLTPLEFSNGFVQSINPGNPVLFPWLSKMSKLYTQYRIHGMVLVYKTMSSNYSASGGPLGTVIMATNYNVNDLPFENKIQMENSEFAVSTDPSRNIVHAIECDPKSSGLQTLYIRDPSVSDPSSVSDPRFFDFGKFQIATTGLPGAVGSVMGEVWCSYDIELIKPIVGKDQSPTPSPVLTPTNVAVSQANGQKVADLSAGYQFASVGDTVYRPTGQAVTAGVALSPDVVLTPTYSGAPLFSGAPGNLSTVLDLITGTSSTGTELRFFRNGVYVIQVFCRFLATSSNDGITLNEVAYNAADVYTPTLSSVGTGITITQFGSNPQGYVPYIIYSGGPQVGTLPSTLTPLYDVGLYQTSFHLRVTGLPSYDPARYARVILPIQTSFPAGNTVKGFNRTLNVGWIETEVRNSALPG